MTGSLLAGDSLETRHGYKHCIVALVLGRPDRHVPNGTPVRCDLLDWGTHTIGTVIHTEVNDEGWLVGHIAARPLLTGLLIRAGLLP